MAPESATLLGMVVVLFSLGYFAMASVPFLFVKLDVPEVWRLFRGLINIYFRVVPLVGVVAAGALSVNGHYAMVAALLLLATATLSARRPVLARIATRALAGRAGDRAAMRQLRQFHWSAMAVNIALLALAIASMAFIF